MPAVFQKIQPYPGLDFLKHKPAGSSLADFQWARYVVGRKAPPTVCCVHCSHNLQTMTQGFFSPPKWSRDMPPCCPPLSLPPFPPPHIFFFLFFSPLPISSTVSQTRTLTSVRRLRLARASTAVRYFNFKVERERERERGRKEGLACA